MATVREHYDISAKALNAQRIWELRSDNGVTLVTIQGKVSHSIEENAKYWSFYLPEQAEFGCISYLLHQPHILDGVINYDEPEQIIGFTDTPERQSLSSFVFTRRVYLYLDWCVDDNEQILIDQLGKNLDLNIKVRDKNYVSKCSELNKPMAFISHDSNDKDDLVRELALELDKLLCPVWYDEFSLKVGDSLIESIDQGLKESRKCILVISPSFISNSGWTKKEFNSILTREIFEKNNVLLPVWHNVTPEQVYGYSSELLNRVALQSTLGPVELAKKLSMQIKAV